MEDEEFWNIVREMGYPADRKGIRYGSRDHEILEDISTLWKLAKLVHEGKKIGFACGRTYGILTHRYREVHWAALRVLHGSDRAIREATEDLWDECKHSLEVMEEFINALDELLEWVRNGGSLVEEDVVSRVRELYGIGGERSFKEVVKMHLELFGEDRERRFVEVMRILDPSRDPSDVAKIFSRCRRRMENSISRFWRKLDNLCREANLNCERIREEI